jgi:transcriptional regulator with XRE-family HTH domain
MNREDGAPPGRWLRQRREDAGLSQEEVADRSGLSVRTISNVERGSIRTPHPRTIRLLGETLGLPANACDELIAACRAGSRPKETRVKHIRAARIPGQAPVMDHGLTHVSPARRITGKSGRRRPPAWREPIARRVGDIAPSRPSARTTHRDREP